MALKSNFSKIEDRIFIGAGGDAMDSDLIVEHDFTVILCLARGYHPERISSIRVEHHPLTDMMEGTRVNSDAEMLAAVSCLADLYDADENILVHCHAGYSRSPSVVIGHLLNFGRFATVGQALAYVQARHRCQPGPLMLAHLRHLYEEPST